MTEEIYAVHVANLKSAIESLERFFGEAVAREIAIPLTHETSCLIKFTGPVTPDAVKELKSYLDRLGKITAQADKHPSFSDIADLLKKIGNNGEPKT